MEINSGRFKPYEGNYSNYLKLKDEELRRQEFEFVGYIKERNRLVNARENVKSRSSSTRRTPRRMGNSEARLHRMGGQAAKKTLDNKAGSIQARIDQLEVKERPKEEAIIRIKLLETSQVHGHILAKGKNINKSFDNNVIFEDAEFNIYNGSKIALIGPNGSGKTSLINMILQETNGISLSKNVKIGYFSQSMDILDGDKTILENVMSTSIRTEDFARLLLARLLFRGERVYDKVKVLSGGERVKLSLAKIILQDINFIILDEPTNYLDISSLEVIEETLKNYEGSILLVSHERKFIENIADGLLIIEDKKINSFKGGYKDYLLSRERKDLSIEGQEIEEEKMRLRNRMSSIIGHLSMEKDEARKKELDLEYERILRKLKEI